MAAWLYFVAAAVGLVAMLAVVAHWNMRRADRTAQEARAEWERRLKAGELSAEGYYPNKWFEAEE